MHGGSLDSLAFKLRQVMNIHVQCATIRTGKLGGASQRGQLRETINVQKETRLEDPRRAELFCCFRM